MADNRHLRSETDPSFIRKPGNELVEFARRIGLSTREMREAVDGGLIRPPATHGHSRADPAARGSTGGNPDRWG